MRLRMSQTGVHSGWRLGSVRCAWSCCDRAEYHAGRCMCIEVRADMDVAQFAGFWLGVQECMRVCIPTMSVRCNLLQATAPIAEAPL